LIDRDRHTPTAVQFVNEYGVGYGVKQIDGKPRVSAMPYTYDIAEGNIVGHRSWSKIGYNGAIGATEEEMWPVSAPYVFPETEVAMTIVSDSNSDAGLTGMVKTYTITAGADQGSGYHANDIITITQAGGTGGQVKVLTIGGGGEVATSELHVAGSGYTVANDLATTVSPSGGTGCLINITAVSTQGVGVRTVTIYFLDHDFIEYTATLTLNGDTPVKIGTNVFRVQNARVVTTGTTLTPVGNLSIKSGATTYGYISAGRTRMRQCTWTVPAGNILYITQIAFSCGDQSASKYTRFTTKANYDNLSGSVIQRGLFMPFNEVVLNNTAYYRELNPPTKLPATVDLKVSCLANATAVGTCSLRGWLETV
jgi:hypothetical protein